MHPWVEQKCRQTCLRQVLAWTAAVLAALLIGALNVRYVANFIGGPYLATQDDLGKIADPDAAQHYFVRVTGTKVIDTGLQQITVRTRSGSEVSRSVSATYYGLLVGDRFLIVKSPSSLSQAVEGELKRIPAETYSQLFAKLNSDEVKAYFYPFFLEADGFRNPGYWGIGIGLVLLVLTLKYARPAWIRLQDISKHPFTSRVRLWGDPITTSFEIEDEHRNKMHYKSGSTLITDTYLIEDGFFNFNVLRFWDLLWAYKRVTKHSVNFIPTGKTYDAVMICYGGSAVIRGSEAQVNEMLTYAVGRAPWAVVGHSKELEHLFNKETDTFCAAVEARRQDLLKTIRAQST